MRLTPTRRRFLFTSASLAAAAALPNPLRALSVTSLQAKLAADPLRPQFHLLPARNWMNDPNGPIFANGQYHMFFQYNPQAAIWGDMSWYHSTSPDMIHWKHQPLAFTPTPASPDAFGCFSGSCIQQGSRVYAIYTGVIQSTPNRATLRDGSSNLLESQCLAYSDDPNLLHWTKLPQPVIPTPPPGLNITGFRDPSIWQQGNAFYLTVGSGIAKTGGCVLLYQSTDLRHWTYLHPLISGTWTGTPATNPCDSGEMWECPEFFPLDNGHVLIYSTQGKVFWQSGQLDPASMTFHPQKQGQLDLGAFYAPKTQLDSHGQRILWGWIQEQRPEAAYSAAGWAGMMSLPRILHLDPDGTLRMEFLSELVTLRIPPNPTLLAISPGSPGQLIGQACGELLCTATPATPFDLTLTETLHHELLLRANYTPETQTLTITTGGTNKQITLDPAEAPHLHLYVDGSVMELIVNRRTALTSRFYYKGALAPNIAVSITSPTPSATLTCNLWDIRPISPNRLSTPA